MSKRSVNTPLRIILSLLGGVIGGLFFGGIATALLVTATCQISVDCEQIPERGIFIFFSLIAGSAMFFKTWESLDI
jgi:hypothetical protein